MTPHQTQKPLNLERVFSHLFAPRPVMQSTKPKAQNRSQEEVGPRTSRLKREIEEAERLAQNPAPTMEFPEAGPLSWDGGETGDSGGEQLQQFEAPHPGTQAWEARLNAPGEILANLLEPKPDPSASPGEPENRLEGLEASPGDMLTRRLAHRRQGQAALEESTEASPMSGSRVAAP